MSKETWERLGFIVEAEGAILCFIVYLIPGLPKDIVCYLFGISPMPLWVFARGLGPRAHARHLDPLRPGRPHRRPGQYIQAVPITAIAVAVALPLYYYRHRIVAWMQRRAVDADGRP